MNKGKDWIVSLLAESPVDHQSWAGGAVVFGCRRTQQSAVSNIKGMLITDLQFPLLKVFIHKLLMFLLSVLCTLPGKRPKAHQLSVCSSTLCHNTPYRLLK